MIQFFVPGIPQPGGSKKAFVTRAGRAVIVDDAKGGKPWRSQVASFARDAYEGEPLTVPLWVVMVFTVPRPKGHFGTGKNADVLKPSAPRHPAIKPDVLKLARSTEDALTGILWADDCQTTQLTLIKKYGPKPGVLVTVTEMPPDSARMMGVEPTPPQNQAVCSGCKYMGRAYSVVRARKLTKAVYGCKCNAGLPPADPATV